MKARYTVALSMFAGAAVGALAIQGLHGQAKPPVYFIVENEISDVQSYPNEYAVYARVMIKANGGDSAGTTHSSIPRNGGERQVSRSGLPSLPH